MAKTSPKKPTTKTTKTASTRSKTTKKSVKPAKAVSGTKARAAKTTSDELLKLNRWNKILAGLHFVQGLAVVLLAQAASLPVVTNFLTVDPLQSGEGQPVLVEASRTLFSINIAYLVAAFFFLSAIAHLCIATFWRPKYEADLKQGMNRARWYEYMVSASVMMVAIAMLSGVYDLSSLIMIFALTGFMNSMGLMMEIHNQTTKKTSWLSFLIGTKAGIIPWIVVAIYLWGANVYGSGQIPTFVYWIYGSMFVFFSSFAVNMYLQYKKSGKWADYLYGEKTYMVLSLVAKSLLAWQVFFGALRP